MRRNIAPLVVLVLAATQTAVSAQTTTVQSLMDDGYTVAGVNTSAAGGGGLYLQKGNTLVYCYVTGRQRYGAVGPGTRSHCQATRIFA